MIKIIGVEDGVLIAEEVCVDCGVKLHDLTPAEVDAKAILKGPRDKDGNPLPPMGDSTRGRAYCDSCKDKRI
tara:strand:+ start:410 stop:625 length:216 start_codon:yes stop_codon:yes gene_type:complete